MTSLIRKKMSRSPKTQTEESCINDIKHSSTGQRFNQDKKILLMVNELTCVNNSNNNQIQGTEMMGLWSKTQVPKHSDIQ